MVSGRPIKPKALLLFFFFSFSSQTGFRFGSIALRTEHSQAARVSPQPFRYILPRSPQALFFFFPLFPRTGNIGRPVHHTQARTAPKGKQRKIRTLSTYLLTCQRASLPATLPLSGSGPKNTFALIYLFYILFYFFPLVTLTSSPLSSLILVSRSVRQAQAQAQVQLPSDHRSRSRLLILGFQKFLVVNPSTPLPPKTQEFPLRPRFRACSLWLRARISSRPNLPESQAVPRTI